VTTERIDIVVSEKGADTVSRKIAQIGTSAQSSARSLELMKRVMIGVFGVEGIRRVIGLSDAYTDFKNRVSVVTRAALGATMAFGVFAGARGIGAVINALRALTVLLYANPLTIIGVAAIVAAGQLVAFSDQILVSAGSLITLQDFGIAAFQFMMDGIKAFIQYFNDNFGFIGDYAKETFGEFDSSILGALQLAGKAVDGLIGLFVGSYRAIVKAFDDLPAALELIFVKAFNAIAKAVASGINFLIDGINKVTALADMDPIQHVVPNVIEATNKAKNHGKRRPGS
jgi:hypothetical protein